MITKYILWKSTKTRLQNDSSIIQHFTWLPNFGNGYLIFNSSIIWISSYITRIEICPSSTVMRGAGWPISHQILMTSLTRTSFHLQLKRPSWLQCKKKWDKRTKIYCNKNLLLARMNEWVSSNFHKMSFKWKRNKLCYVMLCYSFLSLAEISFHADSPSFWQLTSEFPETWPNDCWLLYAI